MGNVLHQRVSVRCARVLDGTVTDLELCNWAVCARHRINSGLHDIPSDMELRYAISTRHSLRRKMPVVTKTIMDCNFGAAPVGSQSAIVSVKLKNDGSVPTMW